MMRILTGDIGGTKTALGLYEGPDPARLSLVERETVPSREHPSLLPIVDRFLKGRVVDAAAFGIAGPVQDGACRATHLPWEVRTSTLAKMCGTERVALLNDVAVAALGLPALEERQLRWLQRGTPDRSGARTLVTVGTGFGRALLTPAGVPLASEGGHTSFAPRTEVELQLTRWMLAQGPHAAVEHVLSGNGLARLYAFLTESGLAPVSAETEARLARAEDRNALIAHLGLKEEDEACEATVAWFAELLGAHLGDVALATIPRRGLFVWGGVALALREALEKPELREAFLDKDLMSELLATVPLALVLEPDLALLGAREAALACATGTSKGP